MFKERMIPDGYMTVGQLAKWAGVTVRTLQYYDREGVLAPSAASGGGRRLYTHKDVVKLHQIQSLKYLGFSLEDIKHRVTSLDTPAEVAAALTDHAASVREKMETLAVTLKAMEALKEEVLQMQSVDFKKYADIIASLQMKNEMYWAIKNLDDDTLEHFRRNFDSEKSTALMKAFHKISETAVQYEKDGIAPQSGQGQALAKEFWDMLMEFTGGDMKMLTNLMEAGNPGNNVNQEWKQKQEVLTTYMEQALEVYLTAIHYDPQAEVKVE